MSSVLIITGAAIGTAYLATMAFVAFQLRRAPLVNDMDESADGSASPATPAEATGEPGKVRAPRVVWKHSRRPRMGRQFSSTGSLLKQDERGEVTHAA